MRDIVVMEKRKKKLQNKAQVRKSQQRPREERGETREKRIPVSN